MSENHCFPVSQCTRGFDLRLQGVAGECTEVSPTPSVLRPPSRHHWWLSMLHLHHLCVCSWHLCLPQEGSSCILAICEIDFTAPCPHPGLLISVCLCLLHLLPGVHSLHPTSQSLLRVSVQCLFLHEAFPPCTPPLQAQAEGSLLGWNK